jgi:hypothetical protein
MDKACSTHGDVRNAFIILLGKPEGKRPLLEPRIGCADNIKMDIRGIVLDGVDCKHLAQDKDRWRALVNTVMNLWVP